MLSSVTVLGMLEKGSAAGSECCFQMFTRDVVKSLLAGVTAPAILSDCCRTAYFSPERFTPMLRFILAPGVLRITSVAGPFSLLCFRSDKH